MSLRKRLICMVGGTLLVLVALLYSVLLYLTAEDLRYREAREMDMLIRRAVAQLEREGEQLWRLANRWVRAGDYSISSLEREVAFWNASGAPVAFAQITDAEKGTTARVDPDGKWSYAEGESPIPLTAVHSVRKGIVRHGSGGFVVAVVPLQPSGQVVYGRALSAGMLLPDHPGGEIALNTLQKDDSRLSPEIQSAYLRLREAAPYTTQVLSSDRIAGFGLLRDISAQDQFVLKVESSRGIYSEGMEQFHSTAKALLIVGLVMVLLVLVLVDRFIVQRISQIGATLSSIAVRYDFSGRVQASGKDELSWLADTINSMLMALEASHSELVEHRNRLESTVESRTAQLREVNDQLRREIAEREAAECEKLRMATFASYHPGYVLELSPEAEVNYFNASVRQVADKLGYSSPDLLLPPDTCAIVARCVRTGEQSTEVTSSMGGRTFSWWFYPVPDLGVVHCYGSDITEKASLEAQLRHSQKLEGVGQLAAGVAHDFNNLLTIIQGYANILVGCKDLPIEMSEPLEEILSASQRAASLTSQLLAFSRKTVMSPEHLQVDQVVSGMVKMLKRLLGEHIDLEFEPQRDCPHIVADSAMLGLVLMNLAINARDAMPRGGRLSICSRSVQITAAEAATTPGGRAGSFVRLSISDTGTGISAELKAQIFEPFFTTKEVGKGSGLGLATVMGIVKQHNGWIRLESLENVGTTFHLFFPMAEAQPQRTRPALHVVTEHSFPAGSTILLVEDEEALRELASAVLGKNGYKVLEAASAIEALKIWRRHKASIDLLITDMLLPDGMSGGELAIHLRADKPHLPVICSSGYSSMESLRKDFLLRDDYHFLPKPYEPTKLLQLVGECLQEPDNIIGIAG